MKPCSAVCLALLFLANPTASLGVGHHVAPVVIDSKANLPLNVSNARQFRIIFINPVRFHYSISSTDTAIAAPAAPASIAPAVSASGALPAISTAMKITEVNVCKKVVGDPNGVPDPVFPDGKTSLQEEFDTLWTASNCESKAIFNTTQAANQATSGMTSEQQCYKLRLSEFSDWLLKMDDASRLLSFVSDNSKLHDGTNKSCRMSVDFTWPVSSFSSIENGLLTLQLRLQALTGRETSKPPAVGDISYADWIKDATNKARYDLLSNFLSTGIAAVQKNELPPSSFNDSLLFITFWRDRLAAVQSGSTGQDIDADGSPFVLSASSDCSFTWYGRGDTKTSSVTAADISTTPAASTSIPVLVNTCYPPGTVSTGLGMSFIHNDVYAFLPSPDPNDNTKSISTIQTTTNAAVTPLYAIQYNAAFKDFSDGIGLHASLGGAIGSTSGTTNLEFLVGTSLSLRRRAFFVTPALQLARRDQLLSGYQIGSKQNSLTALPIVTNWKPGFALMFSFGIGP